jgi:hypothetical protein
MWEDNIYSNVKNIEGNIMKVTQLCRDGEKQQILLKIVIRFKVLKSKGFLDQMSS